MSVLVWLGVGALAIAFVIGVSVMILSGRCADEERKFEDDRKQDE
jgi:hypothetical protein